MAGPRLDRGSTGLSLGFFSGFGEESSTSRVEGAPGNVFGDKGTRFVVGGGAADFVEIGGALAVRPGAIGTKAADDIGTDHDDHIGVGLVLAGRWWIGRMGPVSFGLISEIGIDLVPYFVQTTVLRESTTVGTFMEPRSSTSRDYETNTGSRFIPRGRIGPVVQILSQRMVLTGGFLLGNDVFVRGRILRDRTCQTVVLESCDGPPTPDAPVIDHTASLVPFIAPGLRLGRVTMLLQLHAVIGTISDHLPFGAELGITVRI